MQNWYEEDQSLFLNELEIAKSKLRDYFFTGTEGIDDFSIWGKLSVDDIEELIAIRFPISYPFDPPRVFVFSSITPLFLQRFNDERHLNWDGSLCLFTSDWGEDSWYFDRSLEDVFNRIIDSIRKARSKTHLDEHTSIVNPIPGRLQTDREDYIPILELKKILEIDNNSGDLEARKIRGESVSNIYFNKSPEMDVNIEEFTQHTKIPVENSSEIGVFIKFPFELNLFRDQLKDFTNLADLFLKYNAQIDPQIDFVLLIFKDTKIPNSRELNPENFANHISFSILPKEHNLAEINKIPIRKVYSLNIPDDIFQRTIGILDKSVDQLHQSRILILGLGTLGSEIALELAKSGINTIHLYDFDLFQPVNVCRHIGGIQDIGRYKVDIVKEKLLQKSPQIQITQYNKNPFQNRDNLMEFLSVLDSVDLVIDSTASLQASQFLNKLTFNSKIVIYTWCGPNVKTGRIFRVIPNVTPCFNCVYEQLIREPQKYPQESIQMKENQRPQFIGYRQPGIPGLSIDINFIALFTARFAIQTLLINTPEYPKSDAHHYVWQNEKNRLFDPISEIGITAFAFRKLDRCPICKEEKRKNTSEKSEKIAKILEAGERNRIRLLKMEKKDQ